MSAPQLLGQQVAIVTGGAQGIGLAIAEAILAHGGTVLVADIDGEAAGQAVAPLAAEGANIAAVPCDVTSERDQARVVQQCLDRFGRVDVLVNNAGVTRDGYISKLSEADFDLVLDVSLKGAWLGTRAVAPLLRQQGSGSIVNISSLSGKVGNPGQTNYSAAKAGLAGPGRPGRLATAARTHRRGGRRASAGRMGRHLRGHRRVCHAGPHLRRGRPAPAQRRARRLRARWRRPSSVPGTAVQPHPGPAAGRAGDRTRRCAPAPRVLVRRGDDSSGGSSWLTST